MRLLPLLLLPAFAGHPAGEELPSAVVADITPEGFDSLGTIAAALIPASVDIPDVYLAGSDEECFIWCWTWYEYVISTAGLGVSVNLSTFDLIPRDGFLALDVGVTIGVASRSDPGQLYAFGEVIDLISVEEDCDVWLDPTEIRATTRVDASLAGGVVDFNIRPIDINLDLRGLRIEGCSFEFILDLIDVLDDILGFFGFDIYELIADAVEPLVEGQINGLLPELERTLEGTLSSLSIEQPISLGESNLWVSIAPDELTVDPGGLRLGLAGSVSPESRPARCVSKFVGDGSLATPGDAPPIGDGPGGHGVGVFVDDDLVNQALWSLWYSGLLCQELGADSIADLGLPIPLDTTLLGILAPGAFNDLFPTPSPLVFATRPAGPPIGSFGTSPAIAVAIDDLGLDLYGELDGRMTRLVGYALSADVGVDLAFDGATGNLAVNVDLPPDALQAAAVFNDHKPAATQSLEDGLNGLVSTLVPSIVGGLVSDLAFPLPSFSGLGLESMTLGVAGPGAEHLGLYAGLGLVDYGGLAPGESCTSGCESSCSGGCANGRFPVAWTGLLVLWGLRRRRAA
jgi:hypothetical protein